MAKKYNSSLDIGDDEANSIWGRGMETTNKWALTRACSRDYRNLIITDEDVYAGLRLANHQIERGFFTSGTMMHDSEMSEMVSKTVKFIESTKDKSINRTVIARKFHKNSKDMDLLMDTMQGMGLVDIDKDGRATNVRLVR